MLDRTWISAFVTALTWLTAWALVNLTVVVLTLLVMTYPKTGMVAVLLLFNVRLALWYGFRWLTRSRSVRAWLLAHHFPHLAAVFAKYGCP